MTSWLMWAVGALGTGVAGLFAVNWLRGRVSLETISVGDHVQMGWSGRYLGTVVELQPKRGRMLVRARAGYEFFVDLGSVERWRA